MTCAFSLNEKNMDFSAFEYCQKYQNNKGVVVFSHFKVGMLYITSFLVKNLNTSSIWWAIYTNSQIFVVGLPCSPQFKYDWCNFIMCELGISLTPMSFRHLHKQMKGNPLMLKVGDGGEAKQRVWIWYPLLVGGVPMCLSTDSTPPTSPLRDGSTRGCRRGTGRRAVEGINWCGTSLVHMAKAIK